MLMDHGRIQMEMTCLYEPGINSKCPKIVKEAKLALSFAAHKNGEKLTQYSNTPSCDGNKKYWERYKIKLYTQIHMNITLASVYFFRYSV